MKACIASPNGIVTRDVPEPNPAPTDLLVRVKAAGLNRADLAAVRAGDGDAGKPIGIEFSGEADAAERRAASRSR